MIILLLVAFWNTYTANFPLALEKYAFLNEIMFRQRQTEEIIVSFGPWLDAK